jgi:hypothetical protein
MLRTAAAALLLALVVATPCAAADTSTGTVPRFTREANPIALAGAARPTRYMEASGRRAAFLGREDGSFEAWAYPLKILHDFHLSFAVAAYADLIADASVASTVDIRPEAATAALLASPERLYRESAAHYKTLRDEMTSIESPDKRFDLAFEWGKVVLDKGFVCNPHLGCGLIAGLGPSGTTERPGFGWYFGGDTFINAWAISAYGDLDTVRQSLEFLRKRQRADGKMMHELSQGAGFIRWFEDYPYGYYHADTTTTARRGRS